MTFAVCLMCLCISAVNANLHTVEMKAMQGEWVVKSWTVGSNGQQKQRCNGCVIEGNCIKIEFSSHTFSGRFDLFSLLSEKKMLIDSSFLGGPCYIHALYRIENDELTIGFSREPGEFPTSLRGKRAENMQILVLKRKQKSR